MHLRLGHPNMRAVAETLKRTTFYGRHLELAPGSNIIRILEALRERDNVIVEDNLSSASDDSDSDSSMIIERAPPTTRNHRLLATLDTSECLTCKVVKMTKLPVHASKRQTSRPGQTIGTDLIGPFDVEGMGRKRYTQTFVDFHTRFETVHNLYSKTESSAIAQRVIGKRRWSSVRPWRVSDSTMEQSSKNFQRGLQQQRARPSLLSSALPTSQN